MNYEISSFDPPEWDRIIFELGDAHLLQTGEWAAVKSQFGWDAEQLIWRKNNHIVAAAMVLKRSLNIPFVTNLSNILYIPKGPVMNWRDEELTSEIFENLNVYAIQNRAIFLKIDPDIVLGWGLPGSPEEQPNPAGDSIRSILDRKNWHFSDEQIQFKNTVMLDLKPEEEELLANMKQKTRYNIRLASRKGVIIRKGYADDLGLLYQMYAETAVRDEFTIRSEAYYRNLWGAFLHADQNLGQKPGLDGNIMPVAEPLIAEVNREPVAALILFRYGKKAWYLYGMSRAVHREKMPNYLLQWEAIRRAKAAGCQTYDLWGAPDKFNEEDPLWGVYRFKEGLGGKVVRHIGAWDLPIRPTFYAFYHHVLPKILELMRFRGRKQIEHSLMD